jgi:tRNA threonylcarbamoyladenosine biosynthesis protein TsaE
MVTNILHNPEETEQLGCQWGQSAKTGWLIGLTGDLGAGKTRLVKGLARGLGATDRVHSPTFALINEYGSGRMPLIHLDLYRLETPEAVDHAGLLDYLLAPPGLTVVEWIEHWLPSLSIESQPVIPGGPDGGARSQRQWLASGAQFRWVRMETLGENERRLSYEDFSG